MNDEAVVLRAPGGVDVLVRETLARPDRTPREVVVRVRAVALNSPRHARRSMHENALFKRKPVHVHFIECSRQLAMRLTVMLAVDS